MVVGVDAEAGRDLQGSPRHLGSGELGALHQGAGRGVGIGPTAADGGDVVVRLDDLTIAAEQEKLRGVGHQEHRLEVAEVAVGPPLPAEPDGGAEQIALVLLELLLELVEEGEGVGDRPGEADDDLVVEEPAHLAGAVLHDDVADGDLAIAGDGHLASPLHRHDGGGMRPCRGHAHPAAVLAAVVLGGR